MTVTIYVEGGECVVGPELQRELPTINTSHGFQFCLNKLHLPEKSGLSGNGERVPRRHPCEMHEIVG